MGDIEEAYREAAALAEKIHRLWDVEANLTPRKKCLGAAWDKASEAEFFLKDALKHEPTASRPSLPE